MAVSEGITAAAGAFSTSPPSSCIGDARAASLNLKIFSLGGGVLSLHLIALLFVLPSLGGEGGGEGCLNDLSVDATLRGVVT